jgi:hypothetical protein
VAPKGVERRPTRWRGLVLLGGLGLAVALVVGAGLLLAGSTSAERQGPPSGIPCRTFPPFASKLGFSTRAGLDASDTREPGLRLVEPPAAQGQEPRVYQDPSWLQAGYLGAPILDQAGNVYVAPAPQTSLALNPPEQQNRVYKIDGASGTMALFTDIPAAQPPSLENPFGVLGLAVDCRTNTLYASTVAGSTRAEERGQLVRIDLRSGQVLGTLDGIDGFGLAVGRDGSAPGGRLYFGRARTPEVWSVALDQSGAFAGQPERELELGPWLADGDGRARRLTLGEDGTLTATVSPFTYTLAPPSTAPQRLVFIYDLARRAWQHFH